MGSCKGSLKITTIQKSTYAMVHLIQDCQIQLYHDQFDIWTNARVIDVGSEWRSFSNGDNGKEGDRCFLFNPKQVTPNILKLL